VFFIFETPLLGIGPRLIFKTLSTANFLCLLIMQSADTASLVPPVYADYVRMLQHDDVPVN